MTNRIPCILFALLFLTLPIRSEEPKPPDKPAMSITDVKPERARLGDTVKVTIKPWPPKEALPVKDWVLYLDGVALPGIHPENGDVRDGVLRFPLRRDEHSKDAWAILLRDTPYEGDVHVAVGPESGADKSIAPYTSRFTFVICPPWPVYLLLLAVIFAVLGRIAAKSKSFLRDKDTTAPDRPFSLGRVQMAFWFGLIWPAYVYIGLVTQDFSHIMTTTALVLMGISATTGLSAMLIDSDKQQQAAALKAEKTALTQRIIDLQPTVVAAAIAAAAPAANLAAVPNFITVNNDLQQAKTRDQVVDYELTKVPTTPPSAGTIIDDLLRDATGISLHRLQIVIWTLTLGVVFVCGVCKNLVLPEFDTTLLTLMGISSGTYLGFKLPEKKN